MDGVDEEQLLSPALPGAAFRSAVRVRATRWGARHDGRDATTPPRPDREHAMARPADEPSSGERERAGLRVTGADRVPRIHPDLGAADFGAAREAGPV
ncbi:hypothetical protein GCM10018790_15080 [Kitasatospora xanthocidica]|nr:hypothetical protein GCM10018790_15080 [Kitasatospora xanthocidica]